MSSQSRHPYSALTPNQADFVLEASISSGPSPSLESFPSLDEPRGSVLPLATLRTAFGPVQDFVSLNAGLLLVAGAQAVFSLVNVAVKMLQSLDEPVSTLELIIVRMGITYICSVAYMLLQKVPDPFYGPKGVRALLVFRGIFGFDDDSYYLVDPSLKSLQRFIGLNGTYFSLQYLSLSDATVISFLVPMCTAMCGSVFLKETFTRREAFAGIFSLFGVVLIARPEFLFGSLDGKTEGSVEGQHRMLAIGIALSGVLGSTGASEHFSATEKQVFMLNTRQVTSIRAIGQRAHPMHLLAFFSLQSVIAASLIMVILRVPVVIPTRLSWLGLLGVIGVLGFAAQILLTMGFQRETAGRASMALYTQIVFASVLERIFFHTTPTLLSLFGTAIIMSSAIYVALTKKKEESSVVPQDGGQNDDTSLEEGLLQTSKTLDEADGSAAGSPSPRSSLGSNDIVLKPLRASPDGLKGAQRGRTSSCDITMFASTMRSFTAGAFLIGLLTPFTLGVPIEKETILDSDVHDTLWEA
ncbi:hypothetical protein C8J57DRAFT_1712262 [Mycena rebaudengoi]|nr:hypothetical protein C8J57DRAFT_1712262 [Mycena rebaudengoi]